MDIAILLPFLVLIGFMLLMTRSAKNKQRQAMTMRDSMQPGTGIRTIGGMYARVKEVHNDTILLEIAPGTHAVYAKSAVGAVLDEEEYDRIVSGEAADSDTPVVPDDASSLTGDPGTASPASPAGEPGTAGSDGTLDLRKSAGGSTVDKDAESKHDHPGDSDTK